MVIIGICGKMGNQIYNKYKNDFDILGIDIVKHNDVKTYSSIKNINEKIDIVVDFSSPNCYDELVYAIKKQYPIICGTTGYSLTEIKQLKDLALTNKSIFIWKANYAKGINLFKKIITLFKNEFDILDFIEIHATSKKDKPSGTAIVLAEELGISIDKIQSIRLNLAPAIHEIIFSSNNERIAVRHEVINKEAFIEGFDEELKELFRSD